MQKITRCASQSLSLLFLSGILMGCGGSGVSGKKIMEISELGVSMNIPEGWELDNPQMCHKGDNTGLLLEEDLEGQTFENRAGRMSREFGSKVISESALKINGFSAIKAMVNTPDGDVLLRVYIHKGEKIVLVSFVILKDEYPENEAGLQKAIQSMEIKS